MVIHQRRRSVGRRRVEPAGFVAHRRSSILSRMSFTDFIPLLLGVALSAGWWFIRPASRKLRPLVLIAFWTILYALPWLAGDNIAWRGATTLACCAILAPKLLDAGMSPDTWNAFSFREWMRYLLNPFVLCFRRHLSDKPRTAEHNRALFIRGVSEVLVGSTLLSWAFSVDWTNSSFWLEHVTKLAGAYLAIFDGGFVLANGLLGLTGGAYMEFSRHPVLARTPADFWRRYNRDAGRFLHQDVYARLGRLPREARIGLVFLLNGLLHEYLAFVMTQHIAGVLLVFFLLQGVAVILTWRLRPSGRVVAVCLTLTIAFNVACTVLFFTAINEILPWYADR